MKLMLSALLLSLLFVVGFTQQPTTPPPAAANQLTIIVAEGNNGSVFIRLATPTLNRLQGRVVSTEQQHNPTQNRTETKIVLAFARPEAANDFMFSLTIGESDGGNSAVLPYVRCETQTFPGGQKVWRCSFGVGNYRFICDSTGTCVQL